MAESIGRLDDVQRAVVGLTTAGFCDLSVVMRLALLGSAVLFVP